MKKDNSKILKRFTSKGVFPHQLAFTSLILLKNIFLSPKPLIDRLELDEHLNVLKIGLDPGYFSPRYAQKLSKGILVLADIRQEMLNYTKKLRKRG